MNNIFVKKAGNYFEKMRKQSRIKMNLSDTYLQQDNMDLASLRERYENLNIYYTARRIVDDYIACMESRDDRLAELSYYAGISDAVVLMEKIGVLPDQATIAGALEQYIQ